MSEFMFLFSCGKNPYIVNPTMAEGSTQPRPPPGKCLFKGSLQQCQIWTQTEPSRRSGVACFGLEVGENLLCLSWNEPIPLNTSTPPNV